MLEKDAKKRIKMYELQENEWLYPSKAENSSDDMFIDEDLKIEPDSEALTRQLSPQNKAGSTLNSSKKPPKQSKYYLLNFMMKNSTVSRNMINNEKILKQIFEYNHLQYQSNYLGIVQNYVNRCF